MVSHITSETAMIPPSFRKCFRYSIPLEKPMLYIEPSAQTTSKFSSEKGKSSIEQALVDIFSESPCDRALSSRICKKTVDRSMAKISASRDFRVAMLMHLYQLQHQEFAIFEHTYSSWPCLWQGRSIQYFQDLDDLHLCANQSIVLDPLFSLLKKLFEQITHNLTMWLGYG